MLQIFTIMKENKFLKIFELLFLKKLNRMSILGQIGFLYDINDFKFVQLNSNAKLKLVAWYYPINFMSLFGSDNFISEEQKKEKLKIISLYDELLSDESIINTLHNYFIMNTTGYNLNTDEPISIIKDMDMVEPFLQENCELLTKKIITNLRFDVIDPNTINIFYSDYDIKTHTDEFHEPHFSINLKCVVGFQKGVDVYKNDDDADKYEEEKMEIEEEIFSFMSDRFDEWYSGLDLEILEL